MTISRRLFVALVAVPVALYVVYLVLPLASSVRMSFNSFSRRTGITADLTLESYREILTDRFYLTAWLSTVEIAALSGVITTVVGALAALGIWRVGGRARAYLTVVVIAPLMVSGVARAYGWIAAAGPTGLLPKITESVGLGPVSFLFNRTAVLVGFVHVFLPFVVMVVLARLDSIKPNQMRAAQNLGAGPVRATLRVVLPHAWPAMVAGFLLVFALATGSFAIPAVLGGGRVRTVTQQIVQEQISTFDWPRAATLGVLLCVVTLVGMLASQRLAGGRRR
ncbi:ABC transporter permease [Phytohabitans kaempferiae]|uniref:ABC transporter permease n=1 Tax=Phytohabitans kaempferiae TaxID=1620943 RepID=A0ABV6M7A9_9ACTN